jgi:hypothetical protein
MGCVPGEGEGSSRIGQDGVQVILGRGRPDAGIGLWTLNEHQHHNHFVDYSLQFQHAVWAMHELHELQEPRVTSLKSDFAT